MYNKLLYRKNYSYLIIDFVRNCSIEGTVDRIEACYNYIIAEKLFSGLPNTREYREISRYLSNELRIKIEKAQREQLEFSQNNPNMKPPWIDGNLFSSSYEGEHRYSFGELVEHKNLITVPVYFDYYGPECTKWIDLLILKKEDGNWLVHDVKYSATWGFRSLGTLLSNLPE